MTAPPAPSWTIARFGSVRLDRRRRELSRDGAPQALAPRAFDVLVALIEQRHRVVSKDDLIARCWNGDVGNDGALARAVMNVRRGIGDIRDAAETIGTVHGIGYRFDADVELSLEPAAPASAAAAAVPRLAVLPFVNATGEASLGWIELGLASMLAKSLPASAGVAIVALRDVLVALTGLPPDAAPERRLQEVRRHLDPDIVVCARMSGTSGRLSLRFELQRGSDAARGASVAGSDAAELAFEASRQLAQWLSPAPAAGAAALDLGDPFLNETFARALQASRAGRLAEAAHLLDIVADGRVEHPEVLHELARVHVALGAPRAAAEVEALRRAAARCGNATWLASAGLLASVLAAQRGEMQHAGAQAAAAADDAERAGRPDLAVQCLIEAAHHFGQCFDPRAAALLSRAMPQAERLGNRVLMRDAEHTAGLLCGFRNDWIGALRYHESALAIADTMAEATRGLALRSVGWALIQLGRFEQGCDAGLEAFRCALISGAQPQLGDAAGTAANGCIAAQRMLDAARLYRQMRELEADRTAALLIARELLCRLTFLRLAGRTEAALACIAATREGCRGNTVYEAYCDVALVRVLFHARRYDELLAECARLRGTREFADDPRLAPWVERAEALVEHLAFGRTTQALDRLHAIVRRLPLCETHGRVALDLAWLHLERGEPEPARALLVPLQSWIEQSPPGLLVHARLQHDLGRFEEAVAEQRRYAARYSQTSTPFIDGLLERYEQAQRSGRRQPIERLDGALNFEFGLAPGLVQQLPAELGGPAAAD